MEAKAEEAEIQQLGVIVDEAKSRESGDDKIYNALFVFAPRFIRAVVEVAREHSEENENVIENIFERDGHKQQCADDEAADKDDACAPDLARGEGAVHGEFPALVTGEFILEYPQRQRRESRRKDEGGEP